MGDMMNHEQEGQVLSTADQEDQIQEDEESDEDWGQEVEAYSRRGGLGVRHNLERMHLAKWWGENQFCPSDRHPSTVNKELESQLRRWQENGRRGTPVPDIVGICRTESVKSVVVLKQFDNA